MFRIHNRQELQRLKKLIGAFDNSTVAFPLDIFRNEEKISAFSFGEDNNETYVCTKDWGVHTLKCAFSGRDVHRKSRREAARDRDVLFASKYS